MANDDWDIFSKELKIMNLEMSLNEAKDTADAFYKELKVYKRALELACGYVMGEWGNEYDIDYFLQQAKKELEEEDVKD